jgi:hypothetical protein
VAFTIGLSVIVVNSTMSASFLGTISDQIDQSYARDFTVAPAGTTIETVARTGHRSLRVEADPGDARSRRRHAAARVAAEAAGLDEGAPGAGARRRPEPNRAASRRR